MVKTLRIFLSFIFISFIASTYLLADVKPTPTLSLVKPTSTASLEERIDALEKKTEWDWINTATSILALVTSVLTAIGLIVKWVLDIRQQRTTDLQLIKDLLPHLASGGHRETNTALAIIETLGKDTLKEKLIGYFAEVRPGFLSTYFHKNKNVQEIYKKKTIPLEEFHKVPDKDYLEYCVDLKRMYYNHGSGITNKDEWSHSMEKWNGKDENHLYGPYIKLPDNGAYTVIFELKAVVSNATDEVICRIAVDTNEGQNRLAGIRLVEKSEIENDFKKIELPFIYNGEVLEFRLHHCASGTLWCKSITVLTPIKN